MPRSIGSSSGVGHEDLGLDAADAFLAHEFLIQDFEHDGGRRAFARGPRGRPCRSARRHPGSRSTSGGTISICTRGRSAGSGLRTGFATRVRGDGLLDGR